jgi:acetyl esterase/lipase
MHAQPDATLTYKRAADVAIAADVYRVDATDLAAVVVWLHGGALINGDRTAPPAWLVDACRRNGWVLVSPDYRLAPETKLPAIVEDVEDAFAWVRADGPRLLHADPERIGVVGESAGGYLTLTAGFRVRPRLQALVSLYAYGNLIGSWYTEPSPHPCHHELQMTAEDAAALASGPPISGWRARGADGLAFYQWCRQLGRWPHEVSGWDPRRDASRFEPFLPVLNVTPDYPPTLLIHGDRDTDVPYDESVQMARQFATRGVDHRLVTIPGGEHGFAGGDAALLEAAFGDAVAFLRGHLRAGSTGRSEG